MVLSGRAEAWIEAGVQLWDLAPHENPAGGGRAVASPTSTAGPPIASGQLLASNGLVHEHVLAALAPAAALAR